MDHLVITDQMLRLALVAGQLVLLFLLARWRRPLQMERRTILIAIVGMHAFTRLGAFILLYGVVGIAPPSDVPAFYRHWADAAVAGGLPYSDIGTPFSPLFPYLLAGLGTFGPDTAFVLFFLLCDVIGFAVWAILAELWFGRTALLGMAVIYGANPEIVGAALAGQDETLATLLAGLTVTLLFKGRRAGAGAVAGILLLVTKIFSGLYLMALLACSRPRWRFMLGAAAVILPVLLAFAMAGVDLLYPFHYGGAANERWSPGNVYFLLSIFGFDIDAYRTAATVVLSVGLLSLTGIVSSSRRPADLVNVTSLLFLMFSLISFKSWYLALAAPFLAIAVARRTPWGWPVLAVVAVHGLASVNASAWYEWLHFGSLDLLWREDLPEPIHRGRVALFVVLQIAEVSIKTALTAVIAVWCWREWKEDAKRASALRMSVARSSS